MSRPRQVSDEEIREAARQTFLEQGPAVSVNEVARRLGVSHAALFQRFGSKEKLMVDALSPPVPAAVERLRAGPAAGRPVEAQLVEILADLHAFHRTVVPSLLVLKAGGIAVDRALKGSPPPTVLLRKALGRWLAQAYQRGPRDGWVQAAAESLLGAIEARCFNAYLGGPAFAPGEDDDFVAMLVAGLSPPG